MSIDPFVKNFLALVELDDQRAGVAKPPAPQPIEEMLTVAWAVSRHPLAGGEYYRATRPAALSSRDFGWHTAVVEQIGSIEGSKKVAGRAYGSEHTIEPDVWIFRPIGQQGKTDNWSLSTIVERCHAAGQMVICDLDDDYWAHEDFPDGAQPVGENDDRFEEWCWKADAWLVSTPYLKKRVEEVAVRRGHPFPKVAVAPNCYDPFGLGQDSHPVPGRRIGTRLWLHGRMAGDLEIYKDCFAPLLDELDLTFVHIGAIAKADLDAGAQYRHRSFIDDVGMPKDRVLELPSCLVPEMGKLLGSTISIAAIAVADHPFNYAKTETHAVEVASAGLPIVAATDLEIYKDVPGQVSPDPALVAERVRELLKPEKWHYWSERSRVWAKKTAVRSEATHLRALQSVVKELLLH